MTKYQIGAYAINEQGYQRLAFGYSHDNAETAFECFKAWLSRNAINGWVYAPFMEKIIL